MELVYSLTIALFLTIALMPLAIRFSPVLGLIDRPDASRKQHAHAIPRCGGVAMAIGIAIPLAFFAANFFNGNTWLLTALAVGALIIVVFGILDDCHDLHYRWKFAGQIAATAVVLAGGVVMRQLPLLGADHSPALLGYVISFVFIIGVTNAVNLTDGLDGLAGGTSLLTLSVISAVALLFDEQLCALIALTVIGGVLGFLRFNTYPARVFMGDTGSQMLGFLSACLSILISQHEDSAISAALPLLILGLPILDTLTVMIIRIREGRSPFSPDRNHLHHQMMTLGFRHNEAVAIIYVLQVLLLAISFLLRHAGDWMLIGVYLAFCGCLLGALRSAKRSGWRFHKDNHFQTIVDRRNILLRKLDWFYHYSAHIIQCVVAATLLLPLWFTEKPFSLLHSAAILASLIAAAMLFRHHLQWLVRTLVYVGGTLAVYLMTADEDIRNYAAQINLCFMALACMLALAIRMTRRDQFRLDTQDLLILLIIIAIPLLPFESLSRYAVGEIALRLAVLMYSCEFILGRLRSSHALPLGGLAGFIMLHLLSPL